MRRGRDSDNDLFMVGIRDADHEERRAERQASGGATKSLSGDERPMSDFVGGSAPIRHRRRLNVCILLATNAKKRVWYGSSEDYMKKKKSKNRNERTDHDKYIEHSMSLSLF
jgi:hypothetical protein